MAATGDDLYRLVEGYAVRDHHRTGTAEDARNISWFADAASTRGGVVERLPWTFDRYDVTWRVTLDGDEIPSLPLFYQGTGRVHTRSPYRASVEVAPSRQPAEAAIEEVLRRTRDEHAEVAVIATAGTGGRLIAPNRAPHALEGPPAVLVPGRYSEHLAEAAIEVDLDARITPGQSENMIARFGEGERPLLIGTPLSGWFACAGERGTGIALALELARAAAAYCPVILLGTTGHELHNEGLKLWLQGKIPRPRAVLHIGASVAAGESDGSNPPAEFSQHRSCVNSLEGPAADRVAEAAAAIGLQPRTVPRAEARNPDRWIGEAQEWCAIDAPLLSFAGSFPLFHTPEDRPPVSTTPLLLERAFTAMLEYVRALTEL